jgi:hypothetical protein
VPAQALLAAYSDVVHAYVLAGGADARTDAEQQSQDYLVEAQRQLARVGGGRQLAEQTRTLIDDRGGLSADDLRSLLDGIHAQIQHELQTASAMEPAPPFYQRRMGP